MKLVLVPVLAALALSFALPADAANVARRQARQEARIHQGVRQGDLTRGEARRLDRSQDRIRQSIRRDRADGRGLTRAERAKADARLDRQSGRIARARNN